MSLIVQTADALVAEINAATLPQPANAQRHYRPQFDLAELKTLRVSVVPKSIAITGAGRNSNQHDVSVDVAVQKKLATEALAEIDALMELVQAIADALRLRRLAAMPEALWLRTENAPVYAPEHLEQQRVFTSVLTLTYRIVR